MGFTGGQGAPVWVSRFLDSTIKPPAPMSLSSTETILMKMISTNVAAADDDLHDPFIYELAEL